MNLSSFREKATGDILQAVHRAIADLELTVPSTARQNFSAGEVYDFFTALRNVVAAAETRILIIDPYLDGSVFDSYLSARQPAAVARLLIDRYADDVRTAAAKYNTQFGNVVEVRETKAIHDRIIFIDDQTCWVIGQSIKDAAKAKLTYLVPLAPDLAQSKLSDYNRIWSSASAI